MLPKALMLSVLSYYLVLRLELVLDKQVVS